MKFSLQNMVLMVLMLVSAGLAAALRPTINLADERTPIDLKAMVPADFGDWRQNVFTSAQIINPQAQELLDKIYSETLSRTYVNSKGYQIMLSIAYGKSQSDALQLHKPEICYPAQGFRLESKQSGVLALGAGEVPATRLMTSLQQRKEPVTYWTVVGDHVTKSGTDKKLTEMRYALQNRIPDGLLIRVSSIDGDTSNAYAIHGEFAKQMIAAIAPAHRARFAGADNASTSWKLSP